MVMPSLSWGNEDMSEWGEWDRAMREQLEAALAALAAAEARADRAEAGLYTMRKAITRYVELDRQHQRRISTQGLVAVLAGQEGKPE